LGVEGRPTLSGPILADPVILPSLRRKVTRIPDPQPSGDAVLTQDADREQGELMAVSEELVVEIAPLRQRASIPAQGLL
jgi:hypothetical protein